jgi:hypothetical protein
LILLVLDLNLITFFLVKVGDVNGIYIASFLSTQNFHLNLWAGQTYWAILIEKVNFRTEITEDNLDGTIGTTQEF